MKRHLLAIIIVTITAWVGSSQLIRTPGYPTTHDSLPHIARIINMKEMLEDGQFPPLWGGRLMGGIGSPAIMLNYQLPYYPIMALMQAGVSAVDGYKIVLIGSYILSGLAMYWALSRRFSRLASLTGAIIYLMAPYRFVDIFVRGAVGECVAFLFPPLILGSYWSRNNLLLILGLAGLFLSHPVGSLIFSIVFGGMLILDLWQSKRWNELFKYALIYLIAFGISAYNIIPTLALTKYTHYAPGDSGTLSQFPTFSQLMYSKWGYGISTPDENDGMSFSLGIAQQIIIVLSAIYLLGRAIWRKRIDPVFVYMLGLIFVSIFMMLGLSTPIYNWLSLTRVIDFPWRILMFVVFGVAILATQLVESFKINLVKYAVVLGLVLIAIYCNRNHWHVNDVWRIPPQVFVTESGDAYGEYASSTRRTREMSFFDSRAKVTSGLASIEIIEDKSNSLVIKTKGVAPYFIRLNIMAFPGWQVSVNGEPSCTITKGTDAKIDDSGLYECQLKENDNEIVAKYVPLPIQSISNEISLLALGGTTLWSMYRLFSRHTTKKKQS